MCVATNMRVMINVWLYSNDNIRNVFDMLRSVFLTITVGYGDIR